MKYSVNRSSLRDQVKDILMERILTGQLGPGDRLKELHIANELGISQAPVREAMRWLEAMGYVEHTPNSGARVKSYSIKELIEIYQVREALEISAVQLALNSDDLGDDFSLEIKAMKLALDKMKAASAKNNKAEYAKHNTQFHRIILKMSGNKTMLKIWESLEIQSRVLHTMLGTHLSVDNAFRLHDAIFSAMKNKDAKLSCSKIIEHYDFIRKYHEACKKNRR